MLIGVPKEIKDNENRVGLAPSSVREVIHHGHDVIVEHNAGIGIGTGDEESEAVGPRDQARGTRKNGTTDYTDFH